MSKQFLKN